MPTTPIYALRYPASSDPPDVPTDMNRLATDVEAALGAPVKSYGISLPASPMNGQEAILVDSTTNPTYQWRFRYNTGSSSAYKWEYVGGTVVLLAVPDYTTTATGAWEAPTGAGRVFAVPRAGDYSIDATSAVGGTSGTSTEVFAIIVNGVTPPPQQCNVYVTAGASVVALMRRIALAVPAGQNISLGYYAVNFTALFGSQFLAVTPKRVS